MIKRKQLSTYLKKRFSVMRDNLDHFSSTGEQEEIHRFRVNVKKIKAVINLLEFVRPGKKIRNQFAPLKKIYKQAGTVRTAHIELQLMKQYSLKNEQYYNTQQALIKQLSGDFAGNIKRHLPVLVKVKKNLLSKTVKIRDKDIKAYVRTQLEKLDHLFASGSEEKEYHKARMVLKNLLYTYELFPVKLKNKISLNKDYVDELQDAIGKWHDATIALAHLPQAPEIRNVKFEILKRKERALFQAMLSLTKNFNSNSPAR